MNHASFSQGHSFGFNIHGNGPDRAGIYASLVANPSVSATTGAGINEKRDLETGTSNSQGTCFLFPPKEKKR
jgi:hypothetical protein